MADSPMTLALRVEADERAGHAVMIDNGQDSFRFPLPPQMSPMPAHLSRVVAGSLRESVADFIEWLLGDSPPFRDDTIRLDFGGDDDSGPTKAPPGGPHGKAERREEDAPYLHCLACEAEGRQLPLP